MDGKEVLGGDKPVLCDFCNQPAVQRYEDSAYCQQHWAEAQDRGDYNAESQLEEGGLDND